MDTIQIYNARVTKDLLSNKYMIVDIKPNPQNADRTIFEFENTINIREYLKDKHNINIPN